MTLCDHTPGEDGRIGGYATHPACDIFPLMGEAELAELGFVELERVRLPLKGEQNTGRSRAQGLATIDHEEVVAWRKP